jgi:phosphohistidine phosphatase SixA
MSFYRSKRAVRCALASLLIAFASALVQPAYADGNADRNADAWRLLQEGGYTIVFRHSLDEPGNGDPDPRYRFGDCTYQRQLMPEGRAKAKRIGEQFRARGVAIANVLSSEWCRARDTAQIAFGRHTTWRALNVMNPTTNPFMNEAQQNAEVRERIASHRDRANLVLVTHLLNIQPLLGETPAKGDAIVVRYDHREKSMRVVARMQFN